MFDAELGAAGSFTEQDLQANHEGRLSEAQTEALKNTYNMLFVFMVIIIGGLIAFGLIYGLFAWLSPKK